MIETIMVTSCKLVARFLSLGLEVLPLHKNASKSDLMAFRSNKRRRDHTKNLWTFAEFVEAVL